MQFPPAYSHASSDYGLQSSLLSYTPSDARTSTVGFGRSGVAFATASTSFDAVFQNAPLTYQAAAVPSHSPWAGGGGDADSSSGRSTVLSSAQPLPIDDLAPLMPLLPTDFPHLYEQPPRRTSRFSDPRAASVDSFEINAVGLGEARDKRRRLRRSGDIHHNNDNDNDNDDNGAADDGMDEADETDEAGESDGVEQSASKGKGKGQRRRRNFSLSSASALLNPLGFDPESKTAGAFISSNLLNDLLGPETRDEPDADSEWDDLALADNLVTFPMRGSANESAFQRALLHVSGPLQDTLTLRLLQVNPDAPEARVSSLGFHVAQRGGSIRQVACAIEQSPLFVDSLVAIRGMYSCTVFSTLAIRNAILEHCGMDSEQEHDDRSPRNSSSSTPRASRVQRALSVDEMAQGVASDPSQLLSPLLRTRFEKQLMDVCINPHLHSECVFLTDNGSVYSWSLKGRSEALLPSSLKPSSEWRAARYTAHPRVLYLCNAKSVSLLDTREPGTAAARKLFSLSQHNKRYGFSFHGIATPPASSPHSSDSALVFLSSSSSLLALDQRMPKQPVVSLMHHMEYEPPSLLRVMDVNTLDESSGNSGTLPRRHMLFASNRRHKETVGVVLELGHSVAAWSAAPFPWTQTPQKVEQDPPVDSSEAAVGSTLSSTSTLSATRAKRENASWDSGSSSSMSHVSQSTSSDASFASSVKRESAPEPHTHPTHPTHPESASSVSDNSSTVSDTSLHSSAPAESASEDASSMVSSEFDQKPFTQAHSRPPLFTHNHYDRATASASNAAFPEGVDSVLSLPPRIVSSLFKMRSYNSLSKSTMAQKLTSFPNRFEASLIGATTVGPFSSNVRSRRAARQSSAVPSTFADDDLTDPWQMIFGSPSNDAKLAADAKKVGVFQFLQLSSWGDVFYQTLSLELFSQHQLGSAMLATLPLVSLTGPGERVSGSSGGGGGGGGVGESAGSASTSSRMEVLSERPKDVPESVLADEHQLRQLDHVFENIRRFERIDLSCIHSYMIHPSGELLGRKSGKAQSKAAEVSLELLTEFVLGWIQKQPFTEQDLVLHARKVLGPAVSLDAVQEALGRLLRIKAISQHNIVSPSPLQAGLSLPLPPAHDPALGTADIGSDMAVFTSGEFAGARLTPLLKKTALDMYSKQATLSAPSADSKGSALATSTPSASSAPASSASAGHPTPASDGTKIAIHTERDLWSFLLMQWFDPVQEEEDLESGADPDPEQSDNAGDLSQSEAPPVVVASRVPKRKGKSALRTPGGTPTKHSFAHDGEDEYGESPLTRSVSFSMPASRDEAMAADGSEREFDDLESPHRASSQLSQGSRKRRDTTPTKPKSVKKPRVLGF